VKRILIGILAILMLVATMPVAVAVADGDDDDGTPVNCVVNIAITGPGQEIPLGPTTLLVRNQKLEGVLSDCLFAGQTIVVTQSSINFFTGVGFEGWFGGRFNIGDGAVTGRLGGTVSVAVDGDLNPTLEEVTGGWRSDDPDGRGTLDLILEPGFIEVAPGVFVPTLVGGGSFAGFIEVDEDDEDYEEEDDDSDDDD